MVYARSVFSIEIHEGKKMKALLLGDSIRMGYQEYVKRKLDETIEVDEYLYRELLVMRKSKER